MIIILKNDKHTIIKRYKHKFIGFYLYIIVNWLKGYEVEVLEYE